jgi:hypothetical protein
MWIVRLALRRPYTFVVMAMLIAIGGVLTIARTAVDIFPEINVPVISAVWQYSGLSPNEVEGRMVAISERAMTTTVNSIEHIESQSLSGVGLIRVFFQPNADVGSFITSVADLQSIHASDFFNWQSRALSIGPSVAWPVFEGGRIRANIELQTAAQQELLAAYQAVVLQAFQDVEEALVGFSHEQATRDELEVAVRAHQRAANLARNLYAQGLTDFINVLVAEQSVFTSQDSLAQTERDVALELVALYKAVGGGWEVGAPGRDASESASS